MDRYLKLVFWAAERYDYRGVRTNWRGKPTRYAVIEDLAAARYLGSRRTYPQATLATAA